MKRAIYLGWFGIFIATFFSWALRLDTNSYISYSLSSGFIGWSFGWAYLKEEERRNFINGYVDLFKRCDFWGKLLFPLYFISVELICFISLPLNDLLINTEE